MYKRDWLVKYDINGFKMVTLVNGTEEEMREYKETGIIGPNVSYVVQQMPPMLSMECM